MFCIQEAVEWVYWGIKSEYLTTSGNFVWHPVYTIFSYIQIIRI